MTDVDDTNESHGDSLVLLSLHARGTSKLEAVMFPRLNGLQLPYH